MFTPHYNNLIYANLNNDIIGARMNSATSLPLWSSRGMFNNEYLQVQVTQLPLEKTTDDILSMNTYKCHICDTKVPKQYMRIHNEGERHKLCLKIADIALERARNQMKLDVQESAVSIEVSDSYFCEPCSVITKDKSLHENTEAHRKSVNYIDLLEHFFIVYEDKEAACETLYDHYDVFDNVETFKKVYELQTDSVETDNDENEIKKSNESDISKESELEINIECNDVQESDQNESELESDGSDNTSNDVNESTGQNESSESTDSDNEEIQSAASNKSDNKENEPQSQSDVPKLSYRDINWNNQMCKMDEILDRLNNLSKAKQKENSQKANSELAKYLERVTEKYAGESTHAVEALSDKMILITAVNGDKIKVPVNSFHSIHVQKDKSYCKICENPDISYRHIDAEEHMDKIMVPIEDQNGIRKVDDVWSHCVLCNDLTKNINFHLQCLLHRNKLKQALVANATDINENIVQKTDNSQLIQEHSLVVSHNRSEITCNICNITIPNHLMSIKDHIDTFEHITTYNETIEENKLSEIDEDEFYCVPCDMVVAKCYALGHCNGKKHNKHLTNMLNKEDVTEECTQVILPSISQQVTRCKPKSSKTDSDLICFVCNTVLYNLNNHMNSLEHKKNYFSYLEANKLNEVEEDTFFCIPCNTVILIDYLMGHCNARKHKMHVKNSIANSASLETQNGQSGQLLAENSHISRSITENKQKQVILTSPAQAVSLNGVFDTAIPLKHVYQFTEMSNSRSLLCTICDEEVPYKKSDVQHHVAQIEHVVAFNLMMLWNKIKRKNDKYFCDYCKVDITYFNELSHVTSAGHVDVMSKETKWTVYEYDKVLLTLEFAMSHKIGDRVRPRSLVVSKAKE